MKTLKLIVLGIALFLAGNNLHAQISVSLNLGSPPQWGPAGYNDVHYYYLPDVQAYYDVQSSMFIYMNAGRWVHRANLPVRYRNYDLYHGYKVVLSDYHGNAPYSQFKEHKMKYSRGYRGQEQRSIGDRPGRPDTRTSIRAKGRNTGQESQGRVQNEGRGNNQKMKKDNGRGGGNEKKK